MARKLQGDDFKTEAEITGAGGSKSQLLNDDKIYVTANSINKTLDDAIIDGDIGAGGGGGLDIFYSEDYEKTVAGDLSSGNNATFDSGGTLDGTLSDETTSPISGSSSIKYVMSTASTNDWFNTGTITLDDKQKGQWAKSIFYATYDGDDSDARFVIWDDTANAELASVDIEASTDAKRYEVAYFVPSSSGLLKKGVHVATGNNTKILITDDWEATLDAFCTADLNNMSDWTSFTPTGNWTNVTYSGFWKREGDTLKCNVKMLLTGTPSGSNLSVDLPVVNGVQLTQDTTKLNDTSNKNSMGQMLLYRASNGTRIFGIVVRASDTAIQPRWIEDGGPSNLLEINTPFNPTDKYTKTTNDEVHIYYEVPIVGWTSSLPSVITPLDNILPSRCNVPDTTSPPADSVVTYISFDNVDFDDMNLFSNIGATNSTTQLNATYYTVPVAGYYQAMVRVYSNDVDLDADERFEVNLTKNATAWAGGGTRVEVSSAAPGRGAEASGINYFEKGDIISAYVFQNTGGAVQLSTTDRFNNFSVHRVDKTVIGALPIAKSMVRLHTGNGRGSTNTAIKRFATEVTSLGSAITYADSATAGASFTIAQDGVYSISYTDVRAAGVGRHGVSLNSTQLTTGINSIAAADRLCLEENGSSEASCANWTGYLYKDDVIRAHENGSMDTASAKTAFTITQVSRG